MNHKLMIALALAGAFTAPMSTAYAEDKGEKKSEQSQQLVAGDKKETPKPELIVAGDKKETPKPELIVAGDKKETPKPN